MERIENLVRLTLAEGIGPVTISRLLERFGNIDMVFGAGDDELLSVERVRRSHVRAIREAEGIDPRPEIEAALDMGVSLVAYDDPAYPEALRATYDPPVMLYVRGEIRPDDNIGIAVVGTRRASHYGREQAERFGVLLGRAGFTVVSGLARGVDSFAHRGALESGGRTFAILGSGLKHVYPAENRDLAAEISSQGAVISEFPLDMQPTRENFPRRNRIVAGMSLGVLVIEAPERSGALITARLAAEMSRELFVVPGRIDHDNAAGCHRLIREGAVLVRNLDDIMQELGPVPDELAARVREGASLAPAFADNANGGKSEMPNVTGSAAAATGAEARILSALDREPIHIDHICASTGLPVSKVSSALMMLELKRMVQQQPGKFFVRV